MLFFKKTDINTLDTIKLFELLEKEKNALKRLKILRRITELDDSNKEACIELLLVGDIDKNIGDISLIPSYTLHAFLKADDEKQKNIRKLLDKDTFEKIADEKNEFYLRLCNQYIDVFLLGASDINPRLFTKELKSRTDVLQKPSINIINNMAETPYLSLEEKKGLISAYFTAFKTKGGSAQISCLLSDKAKDILREMKA